MIEQAKEKLKAENKEVKNIGQKEKAVASSVLKTLISFCNQEVFAEAVMDPDKKFVDCLKSICTGVGNSISDLDVYKKAAIYYIPAADIEFKMIMTIGADASEVEHDGRQPGSKEPVCQTQEKPVTKIPKKPVQKKKSREKSPLAERITDPKLLDEIKARYLEEQKSEKADGEKKIIQFDLFGNEVVL